MHRLSVISLVALMAVGGVLALAVVVHPSGLAVSGASAPSPSSGSPQQPTNGTLLTSPPPSGAGGDDDGSSTDG